MNTIRFTNIFLVIALLLIGCKSSGEFDPGPFARDKDEDKTLVTFQVEDASGVPIEGAFVVSYRYLDPIHIRVGEGETDENGAVQFEDQTHSAKGYATVVAPGYNSQKVALNLSIKQENTVSITLKEQDVLKVMSYNILEGFKNDAKLRQEFADWVTTYDPDIILFQEARNFTDAAFATFAKSFGHDHAVLSKTIGFPTGITSKEPITDVRKVIQTGVLHHGYVTGVTSGVRVYAVHLCPFELSDDRNVNRIDRQDEINIIMNDVMQYSQNAIILGGDLNAHNGFDVESFGEGFRYAERDHGVYNTIKNAGFYDSYPVLNNDFKATIPVAEIAVNGPNKGARIDYLFTNDMLKNNIVFSDIIYTKTTDRISDHYPTYMEIKK